MRLQISTNLPLKLFLKRGTIGSMEDKETDVTSRALLDTSAGKSEPRTLQSTCWILWFCLQCGSCKVLPQDSDHPCCDATRMLASSVLGIQLAPRPVRCAELLHPTTLEVHFDWGLIDALRASRHADSIAPNSRSAQDEGDPFTDSEDNR